MANPKTPKAGGREKLSRARLSKPSDPAMERFSSSVHVDGKLFREDIRGSKAHARMLGRQGIVSPAEAEQLVKGLEQVEQEIASGALALDPALEDVHTNVERRLFEIVGDVAGKLHTGRSRNDQIATDFLLWLRARTPELRSGLHELRAALVTRAANEIDVVLPSYTHLQRAQPMRLAHHWLAHFEALTRDDGRLADARRRMSHSPLGAGALAGSTLPIERESTARELGFAAPARNSLDAVSSRDAALELMSALAILMVHLSRLCEELVLWSSSEFGFIALDDGFSTGSSLMPQKKNPDAAELVRGKTGRVVGDLVSLLVTMKGLPLSYNRDMQEDKEPVIDAVETARDCLAVLAGAIESLTVSPAAMAKAASDPLLLATDVADHLVTRGVPFREAHGIVGRLVEDQAKLAKSVAELSPETLRKYHPALADIVPAEFWSAERSLESRRATGAPSRARIEQAIAAARAELERARAELEASES